MGGHCIFALREVLDMRSRHIQMHNDTSCSTGGSLPQLQAS